MPKHIRGSSALCLWVLASSSGTAATDSAYVAPKVFGNQPSLEGVWTNSTITPVTRPAAFGTRRIFTKEEVLALESARQQQREDAAEPSDLSRSLPPAPGGGVGNFAYNYNDFWVDLGQRVAVVNGEPRTSLIIDPPDGTVPALTPRARREVESALQQRSGPGTADGPEQRSAGERCLLSFRSSSGPPMLPSLYNNYYQIVQTPDSVMILIEMVHDVRVIRLGGEHAPAAIRKWMGDSIGRWEGDTLVAETTNFHPVQPMFHPTQRSLPSTTTLKVTERFRRIAANTILYSFTVEDPETYTRPWSGEVPMHATSEKIYEYACHEGNYALHGILSGAREAERLEAERQGGAR